MKIKLKIKDNKIKVMCSLILDTRRLSFKLAKSLIVEKILYEGQKNLVYHAYDLDEEFLPKLVNYEIDIPGKGEIAIYYQGELDGGFLYASNNLFHFSFYNAWYPIIDNYFDYIVLIEEFNDSWQLLHGIYNEVDNSWSYSPRKTSDSFIDVNIMLLNKKFFSIKKNDDVEFYCQHQYEKIIEDYFSVYNQIKSFYLDLYKLNKLEKTSFVYLPKNEGWGGIGYKRANLVVSTVPPKKIEESIILMAHELGHAYGNGSEVNSFEDWMNETNAEWSALLFLEKQYPDLFDQRIKRHKEIMEGKTLDLKPNGDKRPDNVHSVGTLIYYKIYEEYGPEMIKEMLKIADGLEEKSTRNFVKALNASNKKYLSEEIIEHL